MQLLSQLVHKAERTSQRLAAQLRQNGGKPEEAAKSSNSPSSPIGDLILAACNSFQAVTKGSDDQGEQPSSSEDASSDQRAASADAGTSDNADSQDGAVSAPAAKRKLAAVHVQPVDAVPTSGAAVLLVHWRIRLD